MTDISYFMNKYKNSDTLKINMQAYIFMLNDVDKQKLSEGEIIKVNTSSLNTTEHYDVLVDGGEVLLLNHKEKTGSLTKLTKKHKDFEFKIDTTLNSFDSVKVLPVSNNLQGYSLFSSRSEYPITEIWFDIATKNLIKIDFYFKKITKEYDTGSKKLQILYTYSKTISKFDMDRLSMNYYFIKNKNNLQAIGKFTNYQFSHY